MLGQIGKYELLEKISEGGMGELYRARAVGPGGFERVVALKRIRRASDRDQIFIEMFVEEAKVASLLSHQNLVHLYDFGSEGQVHYLAMEMVEGRDLAKVLARGRQRRTPFPIPAAVRVAHQTLLGLDYLHRLRHKGEPLQLVHRDVSPQNVMLSFDGGVKLTDFGIARMKRQERLTHVGVVKGKLGYLSPEQIADLPIDSRSDLFSLGIVLWECLTGARLFPGASDIEVVRQVLEKPLRPPSAYNADVAADLDQVVMHALTRDRDQRFGSAAEMAQALDDLSGRSFGDAEVAAEIRRLFPENTAERMLGLGSSVELSPVGRLAAPASQAPITLGSASTLSISAAEPVPALAPAAVAAASDLFTLGKRTRSMGPEHDVLPEPRTELATLADLSAKVSPSTLRPRRGPMTVLLAGGGALIVVVGVATAWLRSGRTQSLTPNLLPPPQAVGMMSAHASIALQAGTAVLAAPAVAPPLPLRPQAPTQAAVVASPAITPPVPPQPLTAAHEGALAVPTAPARAASATLAVVRAHRWVEVLVDGKSRGFSPGRWAVSARRHEITLRNPEAGLERRFQVKFVAGKTVTLSEDTRTAASE